MMRRRFKIAVAVAITLGCGFGVSCTRVWAKPSVPLGEMTVHVVPQSHIDLAWFWRYDPETIHIIVKHTLETAFENMEKYPD